MCLRKQICPGGLCCLRNLKMASTSPKILDSDKRRGTAYLQKRNKGNIPTPGWNQNQNRFILLHKCTPAFELAQQRGRGVGVEGNSPTVYIYI